MMKLIDIHNLTKPIDTKFLIKVIALSIFMFAGIITSFPTIPGYNITKSEKPHDTMLSEFYCRGEIVEHGYYTRINRKIGLFYFK